MVAIPMLTTTSTGFIWLKIPSAGRSRLDRHTHPNGTEKPGRLVFKLRLPSSYLLAGTSLRFVTQKRPFPLILQKERES
jgi:hypothetical protein